MENDNIFSTLAKYNSARDENYLTEALVFVINSLLLRERNAGIEILTRLCANGDDFSFYANEYISVTTQETTEQGRPDIKVLSPDKLIYIEVKHDSPLGSRQLERYNKALEDSNATVKHVNLLTRFAVDFSKEQEKPYKHVQWWEIYNWLYDAGRQIQDPISTYLIDSFKSFLEDKQMSLQKVGWEYTNGMVALINLTNMIQVAIEAASLRVHQKSGAWDAKGYYINNNKLWCGVAFDNPEVITFEIYDKEKYNRNAIKDCIYKIEEDRNCIWFIFNLEDVYFFSLDKDRQLQEITNFIKKAYSYSEQMRVK
jgi:hypothetical protein